RLVAPAEAGKFGGFKELLSFPCEGIPTHLVTRKNGLLVAAGGSGMLLYEWPDRGVTPKLRGRFPFVDYTKEIAMDEGGIAYLADNFETGLQVVDPRDLLRPKLMAMRTGGFCDSVAIAGDLLAVANRQMGFQIWSVHDPAEPMLIQTVAPEEGGVAKSVAFGAAGMLVLCGGKAGASLFGPETTGGSPGMASMGRLTPEGASAIDAIFLSPGLIVVSSDRGELFFCHPTPRS
ncbi:MAG: hypothetical protein ABI579_09145, partial [Candidatus Sumerlaeota bacterium]